jgi:ADP-heptose:LPS heptosyltransferase
VTEKAPKILLHPGATDRRRRWPSESFAALAVQLVVEDGAQVVIIGDQYEMSLAEQIVARTQYAAAGRVSSIAGHTSLAELIRMLLQASVLVANDSGLRHLAGALGIPTVGIYWCGNLINAGPLSRTQDRVQISWTTHCPVCACDAVTINPNSARCEHDVSFVAEIAVADVLEDLHALLSAKR